MDRTELERLIQQTYCVAGDFPWPSHPSYQVFRHPGNQKWFALVMDLPREKLGLPREKLGLPREKLGLPREKLGLPREKLGLGGQGLLSVVNLKCDPILVGSLRLEPGFFPAYHMNKENWITVALDGSVPAHQIQWLVDLSFTQTAPRVKGAKGRNHR